MKKYILFIISFTALFLTGCNKIIPSAVDKIEGDWRLKSAEKIALFNATTISTGYETGRFSFINNGTATYQDVNIDMNGNWRIRKLNNLAYNDNNSNNDIRRVLTINLYEFTANRILNLEFDNFHFNGRNRLIAQYRAPGYRYKYEFVRY